MKKAYMLEPDSGDGGRQSGYVEDRFKDILLGGRKESRKCKVDGQVAPQYGATWSVMRRNVIFQDLEGFERTCNIGGNVKIFENDVQSVWEG